MIQLSLATNQGCCPYEVLLQLTMNIEHKDWEDWLEIREPKGDVNRQSIKHASMYGIIGDKFMRKTYGW